MADSLAVLARSLMEAADWTVKNLMTTWLKTPGPRIDGPASPVGWLADRLSYFVMAAMFVSILVCAYRMATSGDYRHAGELGESLLRLAVVAGCVGTAASIGVQVGDALAAWLMDQTHVYFSAAAFASAGATPPGITLLIALVVIVAQVAQFFIMLIKNAMVILLVAFIPLTFAATNTTTGKQGSLKALTWLAAFVLYKPIAAVIYAISFKLSSADQSITGQMSGIGLMLLAIFSLPALMKFLVPAAASVTGGNSGALAGAVVGAGLATGAVVLSGGVSGSAGLTGAAGATGATGAQGPTGATSAVASGASLGGASRSTSTVDTHEPRDSDS